LGATLLRPYGSSGRATARSVAGRLPRFRRKPRAARKSRNKERRQGGKATIPTGALSDPQSPWGKGENAADSEQAIALATSGGGTVALVVSC
jgi:hypothetical protein